MVGSFPSSLRQPQLLPGEKHVAFVIRHHSDEWKNFSNRMQLHSRLTATTRRRIESGDVPEDLDASLHDELHAFINLRLPYHWRTVKSLADLRQELTGPMAQVCDYGFQLTQIITPYERAPSDNVQSQTQSDNFRSIEALGAELALIETGLTRKLGLAQHLPRVKGELLWIIAGGTHFDAMHVILAMKRVISAFRSDPRLAFYSDDAYSFIYRTSALWELHEDGQDFGTDWSQAAHLLEAAGYRCSQAPDQFGSLSELEPLYGGEEPGSRIRPAARRRGLFARIFGRGQ